DDRGGAERLEEIGEDPSSWNAQLHADEIVRRRDRTVDRRDVTEAVLHQPAGEAVETLGRQLLAEKGAELSVHRAIDLLGAGEGERQTLDLHHGCDLADDPAHLREELDVALEEHFQDGGIGALAAGVVGVHSATEGPWRLRA